MATASSHNRKSSAVKRILSEAKELAADASAEYAAQPLESNIFEWHFTIRGPKDSEFEHGIYHGRILLPPEYPFRPPNLMVLTPNGRWELNKKICLSFTGYHEEMWQPAWGIRTALLGMQSLMAARAQAAIGIGALDYPIDERKRLALKSKDWACSTCGATCAQLIGSAERPQESDNQQQQALPDGLSVDTGAESRKAAEAEAAASSQASASGTQQADESALTVSSSTSDNSSSSNSLLSISASNSTANITRGAEEEYPASPDPSGTSTPQVHSEVTPHSMITASGSVPHRSTPRAIAPGAGHGAAGGRTGPGQGAGLGLGLGSSAEHHHHRGSTGPSGSPLPSPTFRSPHDAMPSVPARLSAEVLPPPRQHLHNSRSASDANTGGASARRAGVDERAAGANAAPPQPQRAQPQEVAGTPQPGANGGAVAATGAQDGVQLALLDRCIAALTLLIGILVLRMIVL